MSWCAELGGKSGNVISDYQFAFKININFFNKK